MKRKKADDSSGAVLIAAPLGKDAVLAARVLERAGVRGEICARLQEVAARLDDNMNAILVAAEALVPADIPSLLDRLGHQPPWSDIPLIILTGSGGGDDVSSRALEIFGPKANVTLLERPLQAVTLVSTLTVALRARRRQYEVRDLMEQRETVLAGISDAFSALDFEWRYTFVNDRVATLAGIPKEKLLGRVIWEIFPDAVGGEFFQRCHEVMKTRVPAHGDFFYEPWGRWLDTRIYPTKEGIVIFRADITERKEQERIAQDREAKLKESQDRLRLATEAADVGTFDFYPNTGELEFSDRSRELFGIPPDKAITYETYLEGIHPDDRHIVDETVRRVHEPGSTGRFDIEYRTVSLTDRKERWVAERGRAVLDASGHVIRFIGTMLDITERKNAEFLLESAKHEAEEANRAKDRFLAMLSHELRTPLTPVLMTLAALRREPNLSEDLRRDLEMLQRNVELEALLIDDLLDLTRIAHGKLELHNDAVDVHAALEHALSISAADISAKSIRFLRHLEAVEHHCWADPARLQQVFWNLVKNAAKFTPEGGRIEIRTHNTEAHQIVIEISDTGIGIDSELIPRIFDAFEQGGHTITSKFGGLGLGLAISKRVVDLHSGTIKVQSAGPGQGATFTVTLNAMETSLLEGPVLFLESEPRDAEHVQILLVEDHADTARVLSRILRNAGFDVSHAATIAEARNLAAGRRFDLLISDLGLPDGSGLDLMKQFREGHAMKGIALSGFGTDEDVAASAAVGFSAHLTKPVDWERLRAEIDRIVPAKESPARTAA